MDGASVASPGRLSSRSSRSAALRCGVCGSRERVRAPARLHGWQRCLHCSEVVVAPWSEAEALEGPRARTVVLQLPGRAHFMVPRRTLLTTPELVLWLFLVLAITAFCVGTFEIDAAPWSTSRWLGPLLCVLTGGSVAALFARRWATVQHLEISPTRLAAYRSAGSRRFARVEVRLGSDLAIAAERDELPGTRRFRVRLRSAEPDAQPVELLLRSQTEARWIAALLRAAAGGSDAPLRCPGCGAPVEVGIEQRAAGSSVCGHCDAGFVVGVRGLQWNPVVLPCPEADPQLRPPEAVETERRRERVGERIAWQLRDGSFPSRVVGGLGLAWNLLSSATFGLVLAWLSQQTPAGAVGLTAFVASSSLLMFAVSAAALFFAGFAVFGRQRFGGDETTLWSGSRLAGFDLPGSWWVPVLDRPLLVPAAWRRVGSALPIARLTRVAFERTADRTELRFHTPTRTLELAWSLPDVEDRWLRRQLSQALAERLRRVGREVVLQPDPEDAPPAAGPEQRSGSG